MNALNKSDAQIRSKCAREKIYQDKTSDFFKDWQKRAAKSKIGSQSIKRQNSLKAAWNARKARGLPKITRSQKRRMSIAAKKRIEKYGHPKGMKGKKHSYETKLLFSNIVKERWKKMTDEEKINKTKRMLETKFKNGTYANMRPKATWKAAWREFGGKRRYYRSRWESNYGRYLEFLKCQNQIKDWLHEPDIFWFEGIKRGCVSYLPDFKIINIDDSIEYHEVKGWMDQYSHTKISRMAKYYPDIKLIVIREKEYNEIKYKLGRIIPGWE